MRSIIDILDLSVEELDELIATALDIIEKPASYAESCRGKKLATLFFEPSTRTRMSFEAAMYELGGNVISMASAMSSSAAKGESVADTVKTVSQYVDIIAMRHPKEGAALVASKAAEVPVINAGDGGHCHPTQTLADLLTIQREKGRLDNLTVGLCGDLKFGRTVHSLINAMARYNNISFVLISPEELKVPSYVKRDVLKNNNIPFVETTDFDEVMPELDILYMTRVQRERFSDEAEYLRLKDSYILTADRLKNAKKDLCVMHPLPRVNEISVAVDSDPRACYFKQVRNGKYMRMALILKLLKEADKKTTELNDTASVNFDTAKKSAPAPETLKNVIKCNNPRCITSTEQEIDHIFKLADRENALYRCVYCETAANAD